MDLSQLELLGKIAGIGGIAIGAVVLIIRGVLDRTSSVPARQRASMLRLVAIGAFGVGALGIVAWAANGQKASTRGNDSPAIVSGGNATIGPAGHAVRHHPAIGVLGHDRRRHRCNEVAVEGRLVRDLSLHYLDRDLRTDQPRDLIEETLLAAR